MSDPIRNASVPPVPQAPHASAPADHGAPSGYGAPSSQAPSAPAPSAPSYAVAPGVGFTPGGSPAYGAPGQGAPSYASAPSYDPSRPNGGVPDGIPYGSVQAGPYPAASARPRHGLSLASFITGISSVVLVLFPVLGVLAGIAGIVLGFVGRSKEAGAPTWMWLIGLITGFLGLVLSIVAVIAFVALFFYAGEMRM